MYLFVSFNIKIRPPNLNNKIKKPLRGPEMAIRLLAKKNRYKWESARITHPRILISFLSL